MQDSNNYYSDEIRLKDVVLKVKELPSGLRSKWKAIFIISFLCNKIFLGLLGS